MPDVAWQLHAVGIAPMQDAAVAVAMDRAASIKGQHHLQAVRFFPAAGVQVPGLPLPKPRILTVVEAAGKAVAVEKFYHNKNFRECGHIVFF